MKYLLLFLLGVFVYIWWVIHCWFYPFAVVLNFMWDFSYLRWGEYSTKKELRYYLFIDSAYFETVPTKGPLDTLKYYKKSVKDWLL